MATTDEVKGWLAAWLAAREAADDARDLLAQAMLQRNNAEAELARCEREVAELGLVGLGCRERYIEVDGKVVRVQWHCDNPTTISLTTCKIERGLVIEEPGGKS